MVVGKLGSAKPGEAKDLFLLHNLPTACALQQAQGGLWAAFLRRFAANLLIGAGLRAELAISYAKWLKTPCGAGAPAGGPGVLRLRKCFATRSIYFAQDDIS
jgi:hypothetical protein